MTKETVYVRLDQIPTTEVDQDIAFMNIDSGKYYTANATGKKIWEMIDGVQSVEGIVQVLCQEYKVSPEVCIEDISQYLDHMEASGLIKKL